ncbi:hypothetical protein Vretifemale_16964, partial [Volvox reticuliferus]
AEKRRRVTAMMQLPPVDLSTQPLLLLSDPLDDLLPLPSPAESAEGLGEDDGCVEQPPQCWHRHSSSLSSSNSIAAAAIHSGAEQPGGSGGHEEHGGGTGPHVASRLALTRG